MPRFTVPSPPGPSDKVRNGAVLDHTTSITTVSFDCGSPEQSPYRAIHLETLKNARLVAIHSQERPLTTSEDHHNMFAFVHCLIDAALARTDRS